MLVAGILHDKAQGVVSVGAGGFARQPGGLA